MTKRPRSGHSAEPEADPPRRPKKTQLPDDLHLWQHAARSVTPLRKAKARVPEIGGDPVAAVPQRRSTARAIAPTSVAPTGKTPFESPAPRPQAPPPLVPIERRTARRIARGLVDIDARIDLHGLRQADAERRLRAFLLDARSRGLRTVLVITGKGGGNASDDPRSIERTPRGVLRRNVPLWLEQPELRDCVAGIASAHVRHGGEGALYIHLRKPGRSER